MTKVQVKRLANSQGLELPAYATEHSAGLDLLAAIDETTPIILPPATTKLIPTGICIALPDGYEAQIRSRSGLAAKNDIMVLNSPGTIDADYRGEIHVILRNVGDTEFTISRGMRVAQMVIGKYEKISWQEVDDLESSARGHGGFGSTGL